MIDFMMLQGGPLGKKTKAGLELQYKTLAEELELLNYRRYMLGK